MSKNYQKHATMPVLEAAVHSSLSEQSVLSRVSDDPNAFFFLWPSYQHDLYRGCLRWMGNRADAEDALSEIVLKAWKQLPRHSENMTNVKGWLTRLSYNHCMDRQRQRQRENNYRVSFEEMLEANIEIIADSPLPQELVEGGQRSDYLYGAITLLPERLREVVILRFWQDKSYQQIADHLALSSSAVGKRLHEACSLLSVQMRGYLSGDDDHFADQIRNNEVTLNQTAGEVLFCEAQALSKERAEIQAQVAVTYCAVPVTQPCAVKQPDMPVKRAGTSREHTFILPLRNKPTRVEQRLRSLQRDVQRHPTGWKRKLELADFCYAIGRWEEATQGYSQLVKKRPKSLDIRLQLGHILRLQGRFDTAIAVYEDALLQARQDGTRHHLHGLIALSRRDYAQAVTHLTAATKLAPDNAAHWHLLGQVHLAREAYQHTLRAYDMALSLNPDDLIALSESYEPLVALGGFNEALQRVRRTLKLAPHDLHAVKRLAVSRCRMGLISGEAYKETKKLIRVARQIAPQAAIAEAARATYHLCRGNPKKAVAILKEGVEKEPLSPSSWYHYALCLFQSGDSPLASDAILTALTLRKDDYQYYRAAAEILAHAGFVSELQPLVSEMLERFPERWTAWITAGRALVLLDHERGCTISAKATQLQPQLAEPWLQHGHTLTLAGSYRQAIAALLEGTQYIPPEAALLSVRASVWLAESYQKLADEANSRKWWQVAARRSAELIHPELKKDSGASLAMAHYWQGRANEGLGSLDAAMSAYQTALDHHLLYPARQDALNRASLQNRFFERKFGLHFQILMGAGEGVRDSGCGV